MSAKAISEKSGKQLLSKVGVIGDAHVASVKADTNYDALLQANSWLQSQVRGRLNWKLMIVLILRKISCVCSVC